MAAQDAVIPDLQLGDIIHGMSPSPAPQQTDAMRRSASLEPLTEAEVSRIRHRIAEIDSSSGEASNLSQREKELLQMLHRLTESPFLDQTQLLYQAEVISGLCSQRDFLMRQIDEERARWTSQKDGWERMAEALIAQRNKIANGEYKDDFERSRATYESDNKALREKLDDTRTRLQCLENEITKLRPILLMQPLATVNGYNSAFSSFPYPNIQAAVTAEKSKPKKKQKKEPRVPVYSATILEELAVNDGQAEAHSMDGVEQSTTSSSFLQFQAQNLSSTVVQRRPFTGDHYRKPSAAKSSGPLAIPPTTLEFQLHAPANVTSPSSQAQAQSVRRPSSPSTPNAQGPSSTFHGPSTPRPSSRSNAPNNRSKSKRSQGIPLTPLMSDARAEHLLLAARKVGRVRAGIMASHILENQREADAHRQDKDRQRLGRGLERLGTEEREAGSLSYYRQDATDVNASGVSRSPQTPKGFPYAAASPRMANQSFVTVKPVSNGVGGSGHPKGHRKGGNQQQLGNSPTTPRSKQRGTTVSGTQLQVPSNPPTPLSSLLDAARMMDNDSVTDSNNDFGSGKTRGNGINGMDESLIIGRRRSVTGVEEPESPVPKRRRVATVRAAAAKRGNEEDNVGIRRVKSALDVLADQAAAFSSYDQRRKGKGREAQSTDLEDVDDTLAASAPKRLRRSRSSAAVKEVVEKPSKPRTRRTRGMASTTSLERSNLPSGTPIPHTPALPRMISPPGPRSTILDSAGSTSRSRSASRVPPSSMPSPKRSPANEPAVYVDEEKENQNLHNDDKPLSHVASEVVVQEEEVSGSNLGAQTVKPLAVNDELVQEGDSEDKMTNGWTTNEIEEPRIEVATMIPPLLAPPVEITDSRSPTDMDTSIRDDTERNAPTDIAREVTGGPHAEEPEEPSKANQQSVGPSTVELEDETLAVFSPIHIPLPVDESQLESDRLPPSQIVSDPPPDTTGMQESGMELDDPKEEVKTTSKDPTTETVPMLQSATSPLPSFGSFTQQLALSEAISQQENYKFPDVDGDGDINPQPLSVLSSHSPGLPTQQPVLANSQKESDEFADVDADGDIDIEDADADADADSDVDAEAEIDDGEADAEGEVDAEGDPDLEEMEMMTQILDGLTAQTENSISQ